MFVARWQIDARFGQKDNVIELMHEWDREIGPKVGMPGAAKYLTGSIGAREATVEMNVEVESLAELERVFDAMGELPAHAEWGSKMEPFIVSGTSRWEIFRVL